MLHQEMNIPHTPKGEIIMALWGLVDNGTISNSGENTISRSYTTGGSIGGGSSSNYGYSEGGTYGTGATASAFSHQMMQEANAFNAEQARINRQWQEKMANTAYQRAMQDLRKAGLNPILAYTNGGASVGSGATASSAMGSAYTDNYSKSENSGQSSEYSRSWNESKSKSDSNSWSNSTTDIANNLAVTAGMAVDTVKAIIGDTKELNIPNSALKILSNIIKGKNGDLNKK